MKEYVFDSYAIIAYLEDEIGAQSVSKIFIDSFNNEINIYFCIVNWGEVYYSALRTGGEQTGSIAIEAMQGLPLSIIDVDMDITKQAAIYKSKYRMSYADCFAAALSKLTNATLVTGDKEFKQIEKDISIHWIE